MPGVYIWGMRSVDAVFEGRGMMGAASVMYVVLTQIRTTAATGNGYHQAFGGKEVIGVDRTRSVHLGLVYGNSAGPSKCSLPIYSRDYGGSKSSRHGNSALGHEILESTDEERLKDFYFPSLS